MAQAQKSTALAEDHALISTNGQPWDLHKSGSVLVLPRDRISVLRVCVMGNVIPECFGETSPGSEIISQSHTPGCEVVTSDCTCFRWMYSRDLTNTPSSVKVAVSQKRPSCAIVTYTPQGSNPRRLTSVNLVFELDHFYPVVPQGYLWHLQKLYQYRVRTTNATRSSLTFTDYYYQNRDRVCQQNRAGHEALPIAYNCKRTHLLGLYTADFTEPRDALPSFIEPLLWSTHLILLGILWRTSRLKKEKPPIHAR
jgi:hypothetical protein